MKDVTKCIDKFSGDYAFLSNFYWEPCGTCVEIKFQAAKARHDPELRAKILNASTPGKAKRLGREVSLDRKWWAKECGSIMYQALLTKFFDPVLREKLLATGEAVLIEGNYWHDNYWGNCMCKRDECSPLGHNHLGLLLMEVRTHYVDYERMLDDPLYVRDKDIDSIVE
ncbi:MAG: DUF1768 domain-containing protein [Nitrosomonadaceae bacterium]|nr:DUF1768 domain-containing protein [Nitrosomonadaceae bacterium]